MNPLFKPPIVLALCLGVSGCDGGEATKPAKTSAAKPDAETVDPKANRPPVDDPAGGGDSSVDIKAEPDPVEAPPDDLPPGIEIPDPLVLDTTRPALTFADEATKTAAAALAKEIDGLKFPFDVVKIEANALPFLHLAHTADDVALAAAALDAMARRYSAGDTKGSRKVDADYHAVVAYRLASDDPTILAAALRAARNSAETVPPDAKVVGVLVDRAHHHDNLGGRFAALDALHNVKAPTGPIQIAFEHALTETSPQFLALTLDAMGFMGDKMARRDAFEQTVVELTKHPEAIVRGEAVPVLANMARFSDGKDRAVKVLLPLLDDPEPSVRAQAVYAMGAMRWMESAAKLVELLDDTGSTRIEVDGWTNLDGSASRPSLGVSTSKTVGSVAVMSLSLLSTKTDAEFEFAEDIVRDGKGGEDYGPAIDKARAWYAANKDQLDAE